MLLVLKRRIKMEKFTITKNNGRRIPVLREIPQEADAVVIMVHGFTSCKECATGELLLRRMPAEGIGVVLYDQPGHGTEEAAEEPFRIRNCMDSLAAVEDYVVRNYPGKKIFYFASSYGAYLTGLYICRRPHAGSRLMMRSGAVIMPWLFLGAPGSEPDPASLAELNEKGFLMMGLPCAPQIRVPKGMFEDMGRPENDLLHRFGGYDHGGTEVAMVHGEKDPVIPVRFAREFAEENGIPITVFEGQGHSLNDDPDCPDRVADLAIDFFRG